MIFGVWGRPGGSLEPSGQQVPKKEQKGKMTLPFLRGVFVTFCSFFGDRFLVFFWKALFRFLDAI